MIPIFLLIDDFSERLSLAIDNLLPIPSPTHFNWITPHHQTKIIRIPISSTSHFNWIKKPTPYPNKDLNIGNGYPTDIDLDLSDNTHQFLITRHQGFDIIPQSTHYKQLIALLKDTVHKNDRYFSKHHVTFGLPFKTLATTMRMCSMDP